MAAHATIPRAFLQLVRHARPAAARAPLRLVGRQRQPRRPPDRARQRLPEWSEAPLAAAASCRHRGRARADRGRGGRPSRRRRRTADGDAAAARSCARRAWHDARDRGRMRPSDCRRGCARLATQAGDRRSILRARSPSKRGDGRRRRTCLLGARRRGARSPAIARDLARRRADTQSLRARLTALEDAARAMALAMDFGFLLDPRPAAALDRLSRRRRRARPQAATICWPPRHGWPASSPSPRATSRPATGSGSAARSRRSGTARR